MLSRLRGGPKSNGAIAAARDGALSVVESAPLDRHGLLMGAQGNLLNHQNGKAVSKLLVSAALGSSTACLMLGDIYFRGLKCDAASRINSGSSSTTAKATTHPSNPSAPFPFDRYFGPMHNKLAVDLDSIAIDALKSANFFFRGVKLEISKRLPVLELSSDEQHNQMGSAGWLGSSRNDAEMADDQTLNLDRLHSLVVGLTAGYIYGAIRSDSELYLLGVDQAQHALRLPFLSLPSSIDTVADASTAMDQEFRSSPPYPISSRGSSQCAADRIAISPASPTFRIRPLLLPAIHDASPSHRRRCAPSSRSSSAASSPTSASTPTFSQASPSASRPSIPNHQHQLCRSVQVHLLYILALHQYSSTKVVDHWRQIIEIAETTNKGGSIGTKEGDEMVAKARRRVEVIDIKRATRTRVDGLVDSCESGYYSQSDSSPICSPTYSLSSSTRSLPPTPLTATQDNEPFHSFTSTIAAAATISTASSLRSASKATCPSLPPPRILRRVKSSASLTISSSFPSSEIDPIPPLPTPRRTVSNGNPTPARILRRSPLVQDSNLAPSTHSVSNTKPTLSSAVPVESWSRTIRRHASAFQLRAKFAADSAYPLPPPSPVPQSSAASVLQTLLANDDAAAGTVMCWDSDSDAEMIIEINVEQVLTVEEAAEEATATIERQTEASEQSPKSKGKTKGSDRHSQPSSTGVGRLEFIPAIDARPRLMRRQRSFIDPTHLSPRIPRSSATSKQHRLTMMSSSSSSSSSSLSSSASDFTSPVALLDPIFVALQRNSRITVKSRCAICAKEEINLNACPKCSRSYCRENAESAWKEVEMDIDMSALLSEWSAEKQTCPISGSQSLESFHHQYYLVLPCCSSVSLD